MAFKLGGISLNAVAQGVGGLVFGKGDSYETEDDGMVETLLERISNGVRVDDRRTAMVELNETVAENKAAQLALGAMGFPILLSVLREEREDLEMIRSTLEVFIHGLMVINENKNENKYERNGNKNENNENIIEKRENLNPGLINSEIFLREVGSIELLISLLEDDDFYIRYHTIQLLINLITNNPQRIQEIILSTPQAVTKLVDMISEREVIRNEALLLMINLTRSQEEIQKIVVFENAFEKIFNIIKEEGGCDGGIVVQDCIELVNNLIRNNSSNQIFLRETLGFSFFPSLLKFKIENSEFSRQKAANFLCALETITLLLSHSQKKEKEKEKENNLNSNQNLLMKYNIMEILLNLTNEEYISSNAIRTQAFKALGKLILSNNQNKEALGSVLLPKQKFSEPALNHILKVSLKAKTQKEWAASDYVLKCYCEDNPEGQNVLASTITPNPISMIKNSSKNKNKNKNKYDNENENVNENDGWNEQENLSFGNILIQALVGSNAQKDIEMSCRAANILSHIIKNNTLCKERILSIPLEFTSSPSPLLSPSPPSPSPSSSKDLLMPRIMKLISSFPSSSFPSSYSPRSNSHPSPWLSTYPSPSSSISPSPLWLQAILLRLFILWMNECSTAVDYFIHDPSNLPFLIELAKMNLNGNRKKKKGEGERERGRRGYGYSEEKEEGEEEEEEEEEEDDIDVHLSGLACILLGLCVLDNATSADDLYNPSSIVDVINQRIGLSSFFNRLNDIIHSHLFASALSASSLPIPLTRQTANSLLEKDDDAASSITHAEGVGGEERGVRKRVEGRELRGRVSVRGEKADVDFVMAIHLYDPEFATCLIHLVKKIREKISEIFAKPSSSSFSLPEINKIFSKKNAESDSDYVARLQKYIENQAKDLHHLKQRNSVLAADLLKTNLLSTSKKEDKEKKKDNETEQDSNSNLNSNAASMSVPFSSNHSSSLEDSIRIEDLQSQVEEAQITIQTLFQEKKTMQEECFHYRQVANKLESDLQSLSDAYNNLESLNFGLEAKLAEARDALARSQTSGAGSEEKIAEAFERGKDEAREESEAEMNDLLVCLGQEESKVSKLRERLEALGEDCDALLKDLVEEDDEEDSGEEDGKSEGKEDEEGEE